MRFVLTIIVTTFIVGGCAPAWKSAPHDALYQKVDERTIEMPQERLLVSDWWEAGLYTGVRPLGQALSPGTYVDRVAGRRSALDVNAFEEVLESSWFEARIARGGWTPARVFRGGVVNPGPAEGLLTVISGKNEGATPGFVVRDESGVVWFVKFDPPGFPGLATGAELVASRALYAAGYFVPETHLVELDLRRIDLAANAMTRDKYNRSVALDEKRLREFFILLNPDRTGRVRAVFSRRIEGEHLGPFLFRGVDETDPNDQIPHERRRSLRALWVLFAWLNNTDTKSSNTLDTFIRATSDDAGGTRGLVRHYLLDLGDSLGAAGNRAKYRHEGYEPYFDWAESGKRLLALGLRYPYWLDLTPMRSRTLGPFEAEVFDPERWSPQFPNPAFEEVTAADTFWGAAILARFTREHVGALVDAADFDDAWVRDTTVNVLMARRRKLLAYAFEGYTALDRPTTSGTLLRFVDLETLSGLSENDPLRFEVRWNRTLRRDVLLAEGEVEDSQIELSEPLRIARDRSGFSDEPFLTVSVVRNDRGKTLFHLRDLGDRVLPVALERDRR